MSVSRLQAQVSAPSPMLSTCASAVLSGALSTGILRPRPSWGVGSDAYSQVRLIYRGPALRTAAFHHFPPINLGKCVSSSADGAHRQQVLMIMTSSNIYQVPKFNGLPQN